MFSKNSAKVKFLHSSSFGQTLAGGDLFISTGGYGSVIFSVTFFESTVGLVVLFFRGKKSYLNLSLCSSLKTVSFLNIGVKMLCIRKKNARIMRSLKSLAKVGLYEIFKD